MLNSDTSRVPDSSSAGLGGSGPAKITSNCASPLGTITSCRVAAPASRLLNPLSGAVAARLRCSEGLRMSASTSNTRLPSWAKLRASDSAEVDLPSPGPGLVSSSVRGTPWSVENCRAVRTER